MAINKAQYFHLKAGEAAWQKMPKANAELFALTYGATVTQVQLLLCFGFEVT